ncbi:MAG: CDP-alcohol phosphatidyltransferase family protein [Oscillospiraceae bacterium]|nr:CDP-alcohol phosphatidyltransferase family protein [Oscillospiraceae bacterium]
MTEKRFKKHTATLITAVRIIGVVFLLFVEPLAILFYAIYLICGVSDILDGYIARRMSTVSKAGAVLDSVADMMFVVIVLVIFCPLLTWEAWLFFWIAVIAAVRITSLAVGFVKYRAFAFLHTYLNKATGIALFCFPLLYHTVDLTITAMILCGIASISALEELVINLRQKELNRNIRGLFYP